jgi:hypothetical protein
MCTLSFKLYKITNFDLILFLNFRTFSSLRLDFPMPKCFTAHSLTLKPLNSCLVNLVVCTSVEILTYL